ncbi:SHOCT domain-containing protein [Haloarcula onubensis]|uniref:SHOCT domain-containing protein n=1 Tax=Haloarcula onubensis TaxID=2950539 RepID=A0ABU2FPI8_9EURY|nr:SHOCT domain-containing protein [Halomicroarcula sp. S3CR25-11]MDS0282678.1 SHOCT domain-containing protein [Halomicroarcula sp. S3CR25-11]
MSVDHTADGLLRAVLLVVAVIVLSPVLLMLFAMPMMGMMGWWWSDGLAGGLSPLWGVGMMVVWVLVLGGVGYLSYRAVAGHTGSSATTDPALRELRVTYALGDLTDEEFEERRATLSRQESS